jgi:hypothetical protein
MYGEVWQVARAIGVASISKESLDAVGLLARQTRAAGPEVRRAVRTRVADEIEAPLVGKIKAAASGPHGRAAATTVSMTRGDVPAIWLGKGGSDLGRAVAYGSEFGGRGGKKVRIIRRTKRTRRIYERRTTRQFREWRGSGSGAGYWLVPTMRREAPTTIRSLLKILDEALSGIEAAEVTD